MLAMITAERAKGKLEQLDDATQNMLGDARKNVLGK